ncbi:Hypothetical protein, putative [Bodo saltans]|uniref:Uncharacterized protein n=1 Tax=Bodo saltans TaxID=75058 RepID=A0A0S4KNP1_BODSA|nr:Hypothetical protein, putative [Bodo saltans]|eukprot:CUI14508.1 Hypothetical protein, putative [Bodo saltans]
MSERQHEIKVPLRVLPLGSIEPTFENASVDVDPHRHNGGGIKKKISEASP